MSNNSMTKIFDKVKFFDKVKILPGGISNTPTYSLQRSVSAVSGGGSSITFTVNTTNVENGTSLPYTISGISQSDVTSGSLTGSFSVASNTASTTLGTTLSPNTLGNSSASLALDNGAASVTVFPVVSDPSFVGTALLLKGEGNNDQNNNVFLDNSSNNFAITRNGSVTQGSFSPFPLNGATYNPSIHGGSAYFDGTTNSNLSIVNPNTTVGLISGNFTFECWINWLTVPPGNANGFECQIIGQSNWPESLNSNSNWWGIFGVNTGIYAYFNNPSSTDLIQSTSFTWNPNAWYHLAVVRSSGVVRIYINGIDLTSGAGATTKNICADNSRDLTIGADMGADSNKSNAYISNLRIVKGTALYTSNFTPSTSPLTNVANTSLLLNFTNGGVIDSTAKNNLITVGDAKVSTTVKKYGSASMYFDGSSRVEAPVSNLFTLRMSPFTFETWIYPTSVPVEAIVYGQAPIGNNYFMVSLATDRKIRFWSNSVPFTSTTTIPLSTWTHVAVVREGAGTDQTKLYLNGVMNLSGTCSTDYINQTSSGYNPVLGGYKHDFNNNFRGYIDDLRITKNLARYTSNFTPPTGPLTIDI